MANEVLQKTVEEFYADAINYWSEIPATIDGVLGGFGFMSLTDIKGSKLLLKQLFNSKCPPGREYALDCGAGIGRISKFLLTELFDKVDLVEQNSAFLDKAKQYLGTKNNKIGNYYAVGLQDFQPEANKYNVIWIQWVLGHLTDKDLLQFLENCKNGLRENGVIVVKENVTSTEELEFDKQDSSVTRSMSLFQDIFSKANLDCYRLVKQHNFPKGLYSVYTFVLRPKLNIQEDKTENVNTTKSENIEIKNNELSNGDQIDCTRRDITENLVTGIVSEGIGDTENMVNMDLGSFNSSEVIERTKNGTSIEKHIEDSANMDEIC